MARLMFGYLWSDGTWRNTPEPCEQAGPEPEHRREWRRQGFFTARDPQVEAQRGRASKVFIVRCWLESALRAAPLPARTVLKLARAEGFNEWALRRAKKHHGIRSVKVGGRQKGWGAVWVWQFPVAK